MQDLSVFIPFDIEKADKKQRMVYGYASTEAVDAQGEIVRRDAIEHALPDYLKFGNVREMHQPSAVGKVKQANLDDTGLYIGVKVVDKEAWEKVEEGVYNGFSIGGKILQRSDNEITEIKLSEISLVDRPANPLAVFDVIKAYESEGLMEEENKVTEEVTEEEKADEVTEEVAAEVKSEEVVEKQAEDAEEEVEEEKADEEAEEKAEENPDEEEVKEVSDNPEDVKKNIHLGAELANMCSQLKSLAGYMEHEGRNTKMVVKAMRAVAEAAKAELTDDDEDMKLAEQVDDILNAEPEATRMPSDDEISSAMEKQGIPVNEKTLAIAKEEIASKIIGNVKKAQGEQLAADVQKQEFEKELTAKLDALNTVLQQSFKKSAEEEAEKPTDADQEPAEIQKAEPTDLAKLDSVLSKLDDLTAKVASIAKLEERLDKVELSAAPIKAQATTVERFKTTDGGNELVVKMEEVASLLKKNPNDPEIQKRAQELQREYLLQKGM